MSRPRAAEAGFTLIELIVTLAVVALVLAFAYPRFNATNEVSVDRVARQIVRSLRRERTGAMTDGISHVVSLDDFIPYLPAGMEMRDESGNAELEQEGALTFHPNGACSGARWRLRKDERSITIDADWLTGRVSIDAP